MKLSSCLEPIATPIEMFYMTINFIRAGYPKASLSRIWINNDKNIIAMH